MNKILQAYNTQSIIDCLRIFNENWNRALFIVDKDNNFLGSLTEGDIRRSLMNGIDPNSSINDIYNRSPIILSEKELNDYKSNNLNHKLRIKINSITEQIFEIPIVSKKKIITLIKPSYFKKNVDLRSDLPKKHVLIVGGFGYIGSNLIKILLSKNYEVTVLDCLLYNQNFHKEFQKNKNFNFIYGNVTDLNIQLESIRNIDSIVYLAEIVGDPACSNFPEIALKTNFLSISSMATLASYLKIKNFIYTSSCSVYGKSESDGFLKEISETNPLSFYARTKLDTEKFILNLKNKFFNPIILRLGTVFGYSPRQRFDLVVNKFVKDAFFKSEININGGQQFRPNISASDVGMAIEAILDNKFDPKHNIYNLSNNNENLTIKKVAEKVSSIIPNTRLKISESKEDNRDYKVLSDRFIETFNYSPSISIEDETQIIFDALKNEKFIEIDNPKYSNIEYLNSISGL